MYLTVHIYTRTNKPRGGEGRREEGRVHVLGLWAINGDTIWVTYNGEEASKPTEGIKSLPPRMRSFQIRQLFFFSRRRSLINRVVSCIQCRSFYSDSRASRKMIRQMEQCSSVTCRMSCSRLRCSEQLKEVGTVALT